VIESQLVVSRFGGCIRRWDVDWFIQSWMVSLDDMCPGSLLASVSGLIHLT
jgi:hypothetical protein